MLVFSFGFLCGVVATFAFALYVYRRRPVAPAPEIIYEFKNMPDRLTSAEVADRAAAARRRNGGRR